MNNALIEQFLSKVDDSKNFNKDAFRKAVTQYTDEDKHLKKLADNMIKSCVEIIQKSPNKPESGRKLNFFMAIQCINRELTLACPDDMQSKDEKCVKVRDMLKAKH